jgi:hypothetical protein
MTFAEQLKSERQRLRLKQAEINGATPEEADANAQFIVTAVNSHAALVEALENIVSEWGRQKRLFPILAKDGWMEECMAKANAVLAKGGE